MLGGIHGVKFLPVNSVFNDLDVGFGGMWNEIAVLGRDNGLVVEFVKDMVLVIAQASVFPKDELFHYTFAALGPAVHSFGEDVHIIYCFRTRHWIVFDVFGHADEVAIDGIGLHLLDDGIDFTVYAFGIE